MPFSPSVSSLPTGFSPSPRPSYPALNSQTLVTWNSFTILKDFEFLASKTNSFHFSCLNWKSQDCGTLASMASMTRATNMRWSIHFQVCKIFLQSKVYKKSTFENKVNCEKLQNIQKCTQCSQIFRLKHILQGIFMSRWNSMGVVMSFSRSMTS